MSDPLKGLIEILTTQTAILQAAYAKTGAEVPSVDSPFQFSPLELDPSLKEARDLVVAAATQLIATAQSPMDVLFSKMTGLYDTVTLGFVIDVNIPEILKEAGEQGTHVKEISAKTGVDSSYIARVLRYLAARHIFSELTPDVFAHNRLSSLLTKTKSLKEIQEDPIARFDDAPLAAFLHLSSDEYITSSAFFSSFIKNPEQAAAPFNIAYKTPKKMWEWYKEPGNEYRSRRFNDGIKNATDAMFPPQIFISGINGDALKPEDVVVDVGGNAGSETFPKLRYVVQDLEQPIAAGEKLWNEKNPEALKSGKVQLQVHDFFSPQPVKNAAVYFLRLICHDWPDKDARKILANLRAAAGAQSKLVVFDGLVKHVTKDPGSGTSAPYPLLPNWGEDL
ncbi:S-adenosyl-L-methionine-dependent methyltransferase [Gymnopus androsaceus JB14]|uniref:S-adenosyl-L-methionine-dependent methyltransferase n=1 Tax=Gymnopus androsaceus JB14 TaxID=1447944 RepID=A0A6A4I779_9AGAR|nr:S-adenosyl-L-methionine-dependent methyltransferase [Gymnopus androsaceus JB14]